MPIGIIVKGNKQDIVVIGENLAEAEKELKRHKKDLQKFCGLSSIGQPSQVRKVAKISVANLLRELKSDGFFNRPKNWNEIGTALEEKGYTYPLNSLTKPLQLLVRKRELGRIKKDKIWHYVKR